MFWVLLQLITAVELSCLWGDEEMGHCGHWLSRRVCRCVLSLGVKLQCHGFSI